MNRAYSTTDFHVHARLSKMHLELWLKSDSKPRLFPLILPACILNNILRVRYPALHQNIAATSTERKVSNS